MPSIGLSVPIDEEDDAQTRLQKLLEGTPISSGAELQYTPEGMPFYVPSGTVMLPEIQANPPEPVTEAPKVTPTYDVTPRTVVPETPQEQLTKLAPRPEEDLQRLLSPEDVTPPTEEPPPPSDRGFFEAATAPERLGLAKAAELPGQLLYGVPGAVAEFLAGIEKMTPATGPISGRRTGGVSTTTPSGMQAAADWLKAAAAGSKGLAEKVTGTEGQKPTTPFEKVGYWTGEYLTPMKGATIPLTAAGVAARAGLTTFGPEDVPITGTVQAAEDPLAKALGLKPSVPVAPQPNAPTVPASLPPGTAVVKPSVSHTTVTVPPPDLRTTSPPNLKRKTRKGEFVESEEDFAKRLEQAWIVKEAQARIYTPTAMKTFESVAGIQHVQETDYKAMGLLAATLVGMAFAPKVWRKFVRGEVPNARPIADAAPGTAAISIPSDLARAYDDINAPLARIARRAGMDPTAINRVMETYRIQTRNGARALADSAVELGRMETPTFSFRAPVSLNDMARMSTPESNTYLKLWDRADELTLMTAQRKYAERAGAPPTAGPPMIGGQTITDVIQMLKDMEAANPALKNMQKANQGWNKAVRDFQANGEYATIPKKRLDPNKPHADDGSEAFLNGTRQNEIGGIDRNLPLDRIGDPIMAKADAARRAIKARLDNEARGKFIDEMRRVDESFFVKTNKEEIAQNPAWKDNVASFKRRGVREYYTTDPLLADVLKTDHAVMTGWGANSLYATKRLLESTTTGLLAPNFSITSALRSYWIAKFTTEQGFKKPTAIGSVMAIPQQLVPQIARSISRGLDNGSGGMLGELFGREWTESLAKRLATTYDESVYAQLKAAGSHRGSILEQQARARGLQQATEAFNAAAAANPTLRGAQHFWNAWKASLDSIHNGPAFNFVKRNMGTEATPELALRARRLTGDPRTGGEYYVGEGRARRPIRYESDNKIDQAVADTLVKGYGWTMENVGKGTIPWWNATLQGAKRIGEAYLHNPVSFTMNVGKWAMAPAAGLFYYTKSLGNDSNGVSYLDHLLHRRSAYNRQMNFYIPIPGQPAENGIELTFFHELNPFKRATEIALHHMLGSDMVDEGIHGFLHSGAENVTAKRPLREDLWIAAHAFLDTAIIPPMPPLIGAMAGAYGVRLPQGVFGGESFTIKGDPYNQNGGAPASLEAATRALFGGLAESLAGFYHSATQSEGSYLDKVANGLMQVRDINVKKTPLLRDVARILPDISGNTDLAKEVFEHQKEFNDLARFFKKWTINEGAINVKPRSVGGGPAVTEEYQLQQLNAANPGLNQPQPTNPLYINFMQEFYNRFMKESPNFVKGADNGGIAFRSLWGNYGQASQKLDRLKDVNHGTYDRWQREMEPDARTELEQNGIDTTNRRDVVDFYKKKQFDALRVINYVRRSVEAEFSAAAGRPIRLKDIKPFLPAPEEGEAPFMYPELP